MTRTSATPSRLTPLWDAMRADRLDTLIIYGVSALGQYGAFTYVTSNLPSNKGSYVVLARDEDPMLLPVTPHGRSSGRAAQLARLAATVEGSVGIAAGPQGLPPRDAAQLNAALGTRLIDDASGLIDRLRRRATEETEDQLRITARHIERVLCLVERETAAGDTELEVAARIRAGLTLAGAQVDIVQVSASDFRGGPPSSRRIHDGDVVTVFAEAARADGQWVELGALYLVGDVDDRRMAVAETIVAALRAGVRNAVPGTATDSIWREMNDLSRSIGPPTIGWGHASGADEGPLLIGPEEDAIIAERDVLCIHPSASSPDGSEAFAIANTVIAGVGPLSDFPFDLRRVLRRP